MRNPVRLAINIVCVLAAFLAMPRGSIAADIKSSDVLNEALAIAAKIDKPDEKTSALVDIAAAQERSGDHTGAIKTADSISDDEHKSSAYLGIARVMIEAGDIDGGRKISPAKGDKFAMDFFIGVISKAQANKGDIDGAKATAAGISDNLIKAHALADIAAAQSAAGKIDDAKATAATIARTDDVKALAYLLIARNQAKAGDKNGARITLEMAQSIEKKVPDYLQDIVQFEVAETLTQMGDVPAANKIAEELKDDVSKSTAYLHIAMAQVEAGDLPGSKGTAEKITDKDLRIFYYEMFAPAQAAAKDIAGARQSVEQAKIILQTVTEPDFLRGYVKRIGHTQASIGDVSDTVTWAHSLKDAKLQIAALIGVAEGMTPGK